MRRRAAVKSVLSSGLDVEDAGVNSANVQGCRVIGVQLLSHC
jgi:hypothetical protein